MTQKQKKFWNWSAVGAIVLVAGVVWRSSAIASDVQDNTCDIDDINHKSTQALEIAVETRTRAVIWEERFDDIESRLDDLEHLEDMIEDIHEVIVEGD